MRATLKVALIEPPGQLGFVPVASAYLVAYARRDPVLRDGYAFTTHLRHYNDPFEQVLAEILADGPPDVAAFSCQGWSILRNDRLAAHLRSIHPGITIIYGGNHVSHQGEAFFTTHPFVDILVNGEGEITFMELLRSYLASPALPDRHHIAGISYRDARGHVVTTTPRERLKDIGSIPSPYLSGVLDMTPRTCATALLETNRGCPYACSYCYWGGAIGQKIHLFPQERLRAEMLWLAQRQIDSWYICDANFGILPQDAELVEYIVWLRQEYGFPKLVNASWAKNSNERIVKMCARLNHAGVHSAYGLSLQSTTPRALQLANRANMKINRVEEISRLCREYGIVPRGELIWGLPGESYAEFLRSYDEAAEYTDTLNVYPHYLLPNTGYMDRIDEYKIKMERGEFDTDYYYCVEHMDMSREDFLKGLRFIISNNILKIGSVFFRLYPRVARRVAAIPYSRGIEALAEWIPTSTHPMAARFRKLYRFPLAMNRISMGEIWQALHDDRDGLVDMFRCYVEETFIATCPSSVADVLRAAFEFEALTYQIMDSPEQEQVSTEACYVVEAEFPYDFLAFKHGGAWDPAPCPRRYRFKLPKGLWRYPVENWYVGLLSYQAHVEYAEQVALSV